MLVGVCLLWVTGRVLGVSLASMAPATSGGRVAPRAVIAWAQGRNVPSRHIRAEPTDPVTTSASFGGATAIIRPSFTASTSAEVPPPQEPEETSAAIAVAQPSLLQRLMAPNAASDPAQRWQWRESGLAANYAAPDRWSLSAWGVARDGRAPTPGIAPASLGGSQVGTRLAYRLDRQGHWEAFARATSAGQLGDGAEGAIGLAWQPIAAIPARLTIERRQRLVGSDGRSALAAYASGGVTQLPLAAGWRLDGYGAAGVVGVTDPLPFAEAQVAVTHAIIRRGPVTLLGGGGIWAAAQSDVARVDVGPRLSIDAGAGLPRVALDWRQRVAGNAAPASGPALTVGMDF